MSRTRTLIAWLVVVGLHLVPCNVYAQDAGPGREIRAIRHDLPIVLSGRWVTEPVTIDAVVVSGDEALVQANTPHDPTIFVMIHRLKQWWYDYTISSDILSVNTCFPDSQPHDAMPTGFSPALLLGFGLPPTLVTLGEQHLTLVASAAKGEGLLGGRPGDIQCPSWHRDSLNFDQSYTLAGPYRMAWSARNSDATPDTVLAGIVGRAPTEAESWLTQGGNAYFYFSGTLESPSTVHVSPGMTIDVWFPFVLDPSKTYSLTIAHVSPIIGPINGALRDNTLHFVLPSFAIDTGATIMGEIDGDPLDNP